MEKRLRKIYIETTNICNLSCSFCPKTSREKHIMTPSEFSRVLDEAAKLTDYIYLHLMGEPLVSPYLASYLAEAEKRGLRVILTTNGTLLKEKKDVLLMSRALFKVSISVHSYEANAGGETLSDYLAGCADFAAGSSARGIITVFRLWNAGGADALNGKIIQTLRETFDGEWVTTTKGIRIRDKLHIEYGDYFDWPLHGTRTESITCYALRDQLGILCDGTVVPCCLDYDGTLPMGNVFDTPLADILDGDKARAFKKALDEKKPPSEACRTCGFARRKFME